MDAELVDPILVVDDDPGFRRLLETILQGEGYRVRSAANAAQARRACAEGGYSLVLSDLKLPDGDGLDVQRWFLEHAPGTPFVLITGFGTVSSAVEAMRRGALDYLEKPLRSPDELRRLVQRALSPGRPKDLPAAARFTADCPDLIARDPAMLHVLELARRVAPTQATVLLSGESGTGKEVIARCIHRLSPRSAAPFVAVNCAALSPTLIESELFGHEKGAFTGAERQHAGRFERASGGTLFLDEIGELDPPLQAKLLRVLQERTFERVGGRNPVTVDIRLVAASNRDLRQDSDTGRFRKDLYYRLNTFPIAIPPLRERPADIDALALHFLERSAKNLGKPELRISEPAILALRALPWPGNVRELENLIERSAILADSEIRPEHFPFDPDVPGDSPRRMRDIERRSIEEALKRHHGNRTHAARELGISLRTLQYRLKEYGLARE